MITITDDFRKTKMKDFLIIDKSIKIITPYQTYLYTYIEIYCHKNLMVNGMRQNVVSSDCITYTTLRVCVLKYKHTLYNGYVTSQPLGNICEPGTSSPRNKLR